MKASLGSVLLVAMAASLHPAQLKAQSDAAKSYKTNCAMCHGADGSGDTTAGKALKAKDLRAPEAQKQSDAELTETIAKGRNKMPAFGQRMKPEQIQELVAYVRQLGKK